MASRAAEGPVRATAPHQLPATSLVDASAAVPRASTRRASFLWGWAVPHMEMSSHCAAQAPAIDKIIIPAPTAAERQSQQNPWLLAVPRQYEWWVYLVLLRWVFFVLTKCCSPRAAGLTCLIPSTASRVPHVSAQPTTETKPRGAPGPGEGSATAAPAQPHSQPTEPRAARSWLRAELGAPQLPPLLKRQH